MANLDLFTLIDSYEDDYFSIAKNRFALYGKEIAELHTDKTVNTLLNVICSENILAKVDRNQFAKMVKSLFYEKLNDPRFLQKYTRAVYSLIQENKSLHYESRAAKYYENLTKEYLEPIRDKKNEVHLKSADEILVFLLDYMKKALLLYASVAEVQDKVKKISNIPNDISSIAMDQFAQAFFQFADLNADTDEEDTESLQPAENVAESDETSSTPAPKIKPSLLGKIGKDVQKGFGQAADSWTEMNIKSKNKRERNDQNKHVYRLITWLLFYRLCQDEAYIPEE